jgi:cytochrome c biogenesis protein CcmG, thiol:disulfide interchange protein DsbE
LFTVFSALAAADMDHHRKAEGFGLRQAIAVIIILISCVAGYSCSRKHEGTDDKPLSAAQAGDVAPDFRLQDLQGRDVTLSEFRGKVVLLEFWATWCPPCRATVPELVSVQEKYKDRDFVVLGISMDDEGADLRTELLDFSKQFHINYPVLMGSEAVEREYKVWSIPRSFLIDKEGRIRESYSGYIDQYESKVSAEVERLL